MRRLFKRREIWLPTFWGWGLVLIVIAGATLLAGRLIYPFLAVTDPVNARVLVIEGWMAPDELDQAVNQYRKSRYATVITTGGPVTASLDRLSFPSYAGLARDYLISRGLPADIVTAVPAPKSAQDRTYLSAVMVRNWLIQTGGMVEALDLYSAGVHTRRSRALYDMAFGSDMRIGVFAAKPADYDPEAWWTTSAGAKTVLTEFISWGWTAVFFHRPSPGSHAEKWGRLPPALPAKSPEKTS